MAFNLLSTFNSNLTDKTNAKEGFKDLSLGNAKAAGIYFGM